MITTEPAWKLHINRTAPYERTLMKRPVVRATLRALNVAGGAIMSFVALVVVGLYAAMQGCQGEETTGLCVTHAGLVPVLEWPIFVIAVVAPLAGGIAGCVTRRPRWLAAGVAVAVVMFALMGLVSTGQTEYSLFS
ncbi:MAG TPA: hypothetical protein VGV90_01605 [Solirubrobacteraceae bacterium]|nr:hypothetical protein [Solirubrobacteraceae bacterium]